MSAYKIQMLGNYPEESTQHSEQGKSLKSMTKSYDHIMVFRHWVQIFICHFICIVAPCILEHLIYYTPTNALLYCNSLKPLH